MVERSIGYVWLMRLLYCAICLGLLFCSLLPISTIPPIWAAPDIILVLTMAYALRCPHYVPFFIIGPLFLFLDLVLLRAPGLFALLTVTAVEILRHEAMRNTEPSFAQEWISAAIAILGVTFGYWAILALISDAAMQMSLIFSQVLFSTILYPFVILIMHLFRNRRQIAILDR